MGYLRAESTVFPLVAFECMFSVLKQKQPFQDTLNPVPVLGEGWVGPYLPSFSQISG